MIKLKSAWDRIMRSRKKNKNRKWDQLPFAFLFAGFALATFIALMLQPKVTQATDLFFQTVDKAGHLGTAGWLMAAVIALLWILSLTAAVFALHFGTALTHKWLKGG